MDVAGLSEYDTHRIAHFEQAGYSRDELKRFNRWWAGVVLFGNKSRDVILRGYLEVFPDRGEPGLVALAEAMWQDGMQGELIGRILNRKPVD